jgi:hypothetical protein
LACAAAACSLVTSLDGLTGGSGGGPDSSAGDDAAASNADGNVGVNPGDDGAPLGDDGAPGDDGGAQGFDAGDAAPFCASQSPAPTFCDDFDENPLDAAAFTAPWDQVTQTGGSVVRSGGIVTSPPLAMLSTATSPVTQSIDLAAYKVFPALTKLSDLNLAFDVYVASADKTNKSDAVLAAIELVGAFGERWALELEVSYEAVDGGGALDVLFSENRDPVDGGGSGYSSHAVAQKLPLGAWTRVTMDATASPTGATTIALHFGATEVAKYAITVDLLDGQPEILVGLTYASESSEGWAARYDDVTFDVE